MTPAKLNAYTQKDLAQMAKKNGVQGWHSMRKEQLIKELVRTARASKKSANGMSSTKRAPAARATVSKNSAPKKSPTSRTNGKAKTPSNPRVTKKIQRVRDRLNEMKNIGSMSDGNDCKRDRLVVMVRDPFWLHAYWELTRQTIERAKAALGQDWHTAVPVLRVMEVSDASSTNSSEVLLRDIEIHGGVNHWYIDVQNPPKSYRLAIGYKAGDDRFYVIARSNTVSTPPAGSSDLMDENWADVAQNVDKIYAMSGGYSEERDSSELQELFEERLRRPMGSPMKTRFGVGAAGLLGLENEFVLSVDSELIIYGSTKPGSHITLKGEPVNIRPDGTFTVRYTLDDRRQVIPVVATSPNGCQQQTTVVAIERNTKEMEAVSRDPNG
jgi:hypothetical protein